MNTRNTVRNALPLLALLALGACNNASTPADSAVLTLPEAGPDVQVSTDSATPDATAPSDVVANDVVVTPDVVATDVVSPTDGGPNTDAAPGMYVDGCYVGTPVVMTDWLNRCSTAVAIPPRAARGARLLPDGGVSPLP